MSMSFSIREAVPSDADTICSLIRELADFERLSHEANPDPSLLADHLSPDACPRCGALLAETTAGTIGFALFYFKYSTFLTDWGLHLEDLYVRPEHRRQGIGQALLKAVADSATKSGCRRLELSVLDWNRGAIDFYLRLGAVPLDDWTTMRFVDRALQRLSDPPTAL